MYMLDTNICIYIIKKRPISILERFSEIQEGQLSVSVVTLAELQYGVERSSSKKFNQQILNDFISRILVLYWDEGAANHYGKIRVYLEKKGTPIGNMDLMIASHALSRRCTLISNNLREFMRVPNLKTENWV
ncbi:MAG: VapC toxin family PIN domain ribonuclease [Desulfobacteraceae bacterium IS3]|nr:MAG: VapC toxin family PIN domain ribonuclease [Desulfobacteraceae bacterium IS3]